METWKIVILVTYAIWSFFSMFYDTYMSIPRFNENAVKELNISVEGVGEQRRLTSDGARTMVARITCIWIFDGGGGAIALLIAFL